MGHYMATRLRTFGVGVAAAVVAAGCGGGQQQQVKSGSDNATDVAVKPVTPAIAAQLNLTFQGREGLPPTCPVVELPGTAKLATINSTGVSWAIATFGAAPQCQIFRGPVVGSTSNRSVPVDPRQARPFMESPPPTGVFEQQPGGKWLMNQEGGYPFPCPAPGGAAPGSGNGSIPSNVLHAWGLTYAANCESVNYSLPQFGR